MFPRGKGRVAAVDSGNYGNAIGSGLARLVPGAPWFMHGADRRRSFSYGFVPVERRAGTSDCGCSRPARPVGNAWLHSPELG